MTLIVPDLANARDAERLERALKRLSPVNEVNADPERKLVAVSYEGGGAELEHIGSAVEKAGYDYELSPGARKVKGVA